MSLLDARHLAKSFATSGLLKQGKQVALNDFSLELDEDAPTIIAIAGESGSGKTTLARLLLGVIEPSEGSIRYRGAELRAMTAAQRKVFRQEVQAIFQDPFEVYNPFYRVDHVLTTPIAKFGLARTNDEKGKLVDTVLRKVGLRPEETLGRYPHQLSGGQRQRIMIARALLLQPRIIIADEPVSMVDASLRATILESLLQLHQEFGISLIYITHDLTTAYQLCKNIYVLYRGSVAEAGDVEQIIKQPQHPYTQLLVRSIPLPNPEQRWSEEPHSGARRSQVSLSGCLFADRCPHVMPKCLTSPPPLFESSPARAAACYLYDEAPALAPSRSTEATESEPA